MISNSRPSTPNCTGVRRSKRTTRRGLSAFLSIITLLLLLRLSPQETGFYFWKFFPVRILLDRMEYVNISGKEK